MRSLSASMTRKVASRIQAGENGMSASLWVGRPTTPLTDDSFLEKQTVLYSSNIAKTSMAVCHPTLSRGATKVYIAYIDSGELKVTRTQYNDVMERHLWEPVEFSEWAEDVSICFDGTMPKAPSGWVEFKTEEDPWVFWCLNGVLYGKKLYDQSDPLILAEANCSAVSSVRAMWSSHGGFDFGLVIFFLLNGQLYYRQLIDGEWMDAEVVSFGPKGIKWEDIAAFRTWDYRIGIQGKSADGAYYEMFTQFMGVGKQLTEHISVNVSPQSSYTAIQYTDMSSNEHLEARVNPEGIRTYGLSSIPVRAYNEDDGSGNYGLFVVVMLDYPVTGIAGNESNFRLSDSNGVLYPCVGCETTPEGTTLRLEFLDFNLSEGTTLTVEYTPGTLQSPAVPTEAFRFSFVPENLVAPDIPAPEPVSAWNTNEDGTEVALRFSQPLVGDITGFDNPVGYTQKAVDLSKAEITTLNQYSTSYTGAQAVDGNASTYWRGSSAVNWIKFRLPGSKVITHIRMYLGNYYIKTFTVSGSNDGSTWVQLGGEYTAASSTTAQWYTIPIENDSSYTHYRIDTLTAYNSSRIYLYEVELQETLPLGNESKFSVDGNTYQYVPGGELVPTNRTVASLRVDPEDASLVYLSFDPGNLRSLKNLVGQVSLRYAGGTLRGLGGPVADFDFSFLPEGLRPKHHPNAEEHIEASIEVNSKLTRVYYTDAKTEEHLEVLVLPVGDLISIDDI